MDQAQRGRYVRDGFVAPFEAMSGAEARRYRARLEDFERVQGGSLTAIDPRFRYKTHVLLPWVAELVRHPRILDAVEALIGPDILCWTCTWFIKEPMSPALTVAHQDATYFGLRPHRHVTAWLALSSASEESGCLRFVPGSPGLGQLRHIPRADPNSINGGGQRTEREFALAESVAVPLEPGQFSLHHTLCVHFSGPNRTADRRIGLGISYVPASVSHIGTYRMSATPVRGEGGERHFDFEPTPRHDAGALPGSDADRAHAAAYRRYREGYNEQIEWHAAGRGWAPGAA